MNKLSYVGLKCVRWSGWILIPVTLGFLVTGYIMTGRWDLDRLLDERRALAWHRLLHGPLWILLVVHVIPAMYLALQRWGWIKSRHRG